MAKPRKTNKRLYVCQDCGHREYHNRFRMGRRCKAHCANCGSTFLVPASENTYDEMAEAHDAKKARIALAERKMGK